MQKSPLLLIVSLAWLPGCLVDFGAGDSGLCGNGVLDAREECDDGNTEPGDGCGANCGVEAGWECSGQPSVCVSLCGNGQLDSGEQCDGVDLNGATCVSVGSYVGGTLLCQPSCAFDLSGCVPILCGDGIISPGEACDDGNTTGGDGCNVVCNVEVGWICSGEPSSCTPLCGNGQLDLGEECDGAQLGGQTCQSLGYNTGQLSCAGGCTFDTTDCSMLTCGNGQVDSPEQCDGNDLGGATCQSLGFLSGTLGCTASCSFNTNGCNGPECGDGIITSSIGEQCDDGNTAGGDGCNGSCQVESGWLCSGQPSSCGPSCGNGSVNPGEECDTNDLGGATCVTLGFDSGTLTCSSWCTYDTGGCVNQCYRCPIDSATYADLGTCNAQCVDVQSCTLQSVTASGALTIHDCDWNNDCFPNYSLGRISASGDTITFHNDEAFGWSIIGTITLTNAAASGDLTIVDCDWNNTCIPAYYLGRISASGNMITFYDDGDFGWMAIGFITLTGATASGEVIIRDCDWNSSCSPDYNLGRIEASGNTINFLHDGVTGFSTIGSITLTATNYDCPIQASLPCSGSPQTCTESQSCTVTTSNCP